MEATEEEIQESFGDDPEAPLDPVDSDIGFIA